MQYYDTGEKKEEIFERHFKVCGSSEWTWWWSKSGKRTTWCHDREKAASRGNRTPSWTLEGFHVTTTPLTRRDGDIISKLELNYVLEKQTSTMHMWSVDPVCLQQLLVLLGKWKDNFLRPPVAQLSQNIWMKTFSKEMTKKLDRLYSYLNLMKVSNITNYWHKRLSTSKTV